MHWERYPLLVKPCTQVQYVYHEPALPQVPSPRGRWLAWKLWQHTPLKTTKCLWAVENTECLKEKTVVGETRSPMASKSTGMGSWTVVSHHHHTAWAWKWVLSSASSPVLGVYVAFCATSKAGLEALFFCLLGGMSPGLQSRAWLRPPGFQGVSNPSVGSEALRTPHWNWCSAPDSSFIFYDSASQCYFGS